MDEPARKGILKALLRNHLLEYKSLNKALIACRVQFWFRSVKDGRNMPQTFLA
jgi:hypothetical protein